jgi:hypothetical protein
MGFAVGLRLRVGLGIKPGLGLLTTVPLQAVSKIRKRQEIIFIRSRDFLLDRIDMFTLCK